MPLPVQAALASVQELQQLKKEGPSAFVALEPISACYFINQFANIPHPSDMQAAYGSFGSLVEDKWNLCLGYLSPERVKSPAMIVYDISQAFMLYSIALHGQSPLLQA